jgi:hypothetical protein
MRLYWSAQIDASMKLVFDRVRCKRPVFLLQSGESLDEANRTLGPPQIRLSAGRARDLPAAAAGAVNQTDVATVYKQHASMRFVPSAVGGWRRLHLVVGQLARFTAVASHYVGG